VTVAGKVKGESGFAIDFKKLKHLLRTEIIEKVDHKHLNYDVDFLNGTIQLRRISPFLLARAEPKIGEAKLYSIRLHETEIIW